MGGICEAGSLCGQGVLVTAVSLVCSLLQLVRECKEVLKGGLLMKQYYQFMLQEVLDGLEKTDCNMDAFEEDLQKMLMVREGISVCVHSELQSDLLLSVWQWMTFFPPRALF